MKKRIAILMCLIILTCTALPAYARERYVVPNLMNWSIAFNYFAEKLATADHLSAPADIPLTGTTLSDDPNNLTVGYSGVKVYNGGNYSADGTVTFGCGSGLERDNASDYWYVSLTFSPEVSESTKFVTAFAFMLANIDAGLPIPTGDNMLTMIGELLDILFASDDIAIQMGDLIIVHKLLPGDLHLLALDTVQYYDEFYYNDTENFYVMD